MKYLHKGSYDVTMSNMTVSYRNRSRVKIHVAQYVFGQVTWRGRPPKNFPL